MVHLGSWRGQALTLAIKSNCLTLSLQSGRNSTVYSWDNTGRLWTAMAADISYRRGLDGKVVAKWQTGPDLRARRWLTADESGRLQEDARKTAAELLADLGAGQIQNTPLPDIEDLASLQRAAAFSFERYQEDSAGYRKIYQPVGILPPDQYMAVVLQAAEGCSFNTCTFCTFYRDRRFRIKAPAEFREHARAVSDFLGEGLSLRRTVFLGDANALVIPMPRLIPLLEITQEVFDIGRLGGIYAFLDGFSAEKKSAEDYLRLAQLGLKRVYIGLESGHDPLLQFLKKPGHARDAVQAVKALKSGGVSVGIIVLLGAGGKRFAAAHIADTIEALNQMGLDAEDLLYFSELIETEDLTYTRDAYAQNLEPLSSEERILQGETIEQALVFDPERGVPHISRYDIREFIY